MTLASTNLVPELQYWANYFVINSSVNKNSIPISTTLDEVYLPQKSFIELLFSSGYSDEEYFYQYAEDTNKYSWPYVIKTRMGVYPASAKYYTLTDSAGTNIFNLEQHDITLLNALLAYRLDSTAVTIITDTTAVEFISNVLYANYNILNTNLSKLIFLYLDLKIYERYTNYDNENLVSEGSLLESLYETYVLDEMFKLVSVRST